MSSPTETTAGTALTPILNSDLLDSVSFEDHEGEERVTVRAELTSDGIKLLIEHYPATASEILNVDTKTWELNDG